MCQSYNLYYSWTRRGRLKDCLVFVHHILREIYPYYMISFLFLRAEPLTIITAFLIDICIALSAHFLPSLYVRIHLLIFLSSTNELSISNCSFQFSVIFHLLYENPEPSTPFNSAVWIFYLELRFSQWISIAVVLPTVCCVKVGCLCHYRVWEFSP